MSFAQTQIGLESLTKLRQTITVISRFPFACILFCVLHCIVLTSPVEPARIPARARTGGRGIWHLGLYHILVNGPLNGTLNADKEYVIMTPFPFILKL